MRLTARVRKQVLHMHLLVLTDYHGSIHCNEKLPDHLDNEFVLNAYKFN